jgi:hypothetical protein
MTSAIFHIAKYMPDPKRREPRNIGVILWTPKRVAYRFLKQDDASFVLDKAAYQRWIDFWSYTIEKDDLEIRGQKTSVRETAFLSELARTQQGNYILEDAGETLDAIRVQDVPRLADQLFADLVSTKHGALSETPVDALSQDCERLFEETGWWDRADFQVDPSYDIQIGDLTKPFKFHFAIGDNGTPKSVFRKSRIGNDLNVDGTAFIFQWATKSALVQKDRCVTLIRATADEEKSKVLGPRIDLLRQFSTVVNVGNLDRAVSDIQHLTRNLSA